MKTNPIYNETVLDNFNAYSGLNLYQLPAEERSLLEQQGRICKARKKSSLFYEGESPKGLYVLLKGKVKLLRLNPDGSEQIFFIYALGDIFGYRPILSGTRHTHSVIAIEDCEYLCIDRENLLDITKQSGTMSSLFLNAICREFTMLSNMLNVISRKSIKERTAYFLLVLNEKYKLPGQPFNESEIKVSRGDLASYIGASIENLIRTIREFKEKNYIQVDGKSIYIRNFEALRAMMSFQPLS